MGLKIIDIAAILLNIAHCAYSDHILSCNVTSLYPCPGENQICDAATSQCQCKDGFKLVDDTCEAPDPDEPTSHVATTIIVTIFTLALLICGIILVFRKYDLANYIRQKINLRRNNDVMYEDVMIGQDDPPLSP